MRKSIFIAFAAALLALGPVALAQDSQGFPDLKAAREDLSLALEKLRAANNGSAQYGGHRDRAEQLVTEADKEIVKAYEYAKSQKK